MCTAVQLQIPCSKLCVHASWHHSLTVGSSDSCVVIPTHTQININMAMKKAMKKAAKAAPAPKAMKAKK